MTSVPLPNPNLHAQPRPMAAAAPTTSAGAIDPIRLLNKYKFLLAGVAVAGAVVGTGAHFVLRKVYPQWRPVAMFDVVPPTEGAGQLAPMSSQEEMSRFMQTQVLILTSSQVLNRVAEDPSLATAAPGWAAKYMQVDKSTGIKAFDSAKALKDLRSDVKSRVLPGSNIIELSMSGTDKYDTTAIVRLVREKYMAQLADRGRAGLDDKIEALTNTIRTLDAEAEGISLQKVTLISQGQVDSIDNRVEAGRQEISETRRQLIEVQRTLDSAQTKLAQMQAEWENPGGIVYGEELREEVERDPQLMDLKTQIQRMQTDQKTLLQNGVDRQHRQFRMIESQIAAAEQNLQEKRDVLMKDKFAAQLDSYRNAVASFEAQEKTLVDRDTTATKRLQDLQRIQSQYNDLDDRLRGRIQTRNTVADSLANVMAQAQTSSVNRVTELEIERPPNEMSFPQLKIMLPAGIALFLGLTAGIVLLMEIVDQRVKSPSDITLIPRARLVGWVPDASEDPAGQGAVETAFRDRPKGIVAESFRQVRSAISKRISHLDHKTILVVSGMPASGATSVASNLALAFAASERKVLLVDANFRRPSLHRIFAVPDAPGLADVLVGNREISQAVQATNTPNLDVLAAGSKEHRVYERLSTEVMSNTLAQLKAMYDIILIDVAPAVVGGEALALANRCDASVMVVRAMSDKRGMVARIKNDLTESRSELLGAIVNGVKSSAGGYMKSNIKTAHEYQSA